MDRVSFFIDGFNVYHSLNITVPDPANPGHQKFKYKKFLWLDLQKLAEKFVRGHDTLSDVYYFSAYAFWRHDAVRRHQLFVRALESTGVKIILGKFKNKQSYCNRCHRWYWGHEEKQTDVNIGIQLIKEAYENSFDKAILITNDTDLIPAIKMLKSTFPMKQVGILFPIDRHSNELKQACDFSFTTWKSNLRQCQFPDPYTLPNGTVLNKPSTWINRSLIP